MKHIPCLHQSQWCFFYLQKIVLDELSTLIGFFVWKKFITFAFCFVAIFGLNKLSQLSIWPLWPFLFTENDLYGHSTTTGFFIRRNAFVLHNILNGVFWTCEKCLDWAFNFYRVFCLRKTHCMHI